jgi:predicted HTH transcriptional regulator
MKATMGTSAMADNLIERLYPEIVGSLSSRSIERNIRKLQEQGRLRRIGPAKGGHWEVE